MEVDFATQQEEQQGYQQQEEDEEDDQILKHAMTQKKRSYRLEIRKKKLQSAFDKTRKQIQFGQQQQHQNYNQNNGFYGELQNQHYNNDGQNNLQQDQMIENLYEHNKNLIQEYKKQLDLKTEYEQILNIVNELNQIIYNFDPSNMKQLEQLVQIILKDYLIDEKPKELMDMIKQLMVHFSLHLVIKNPQVDLQIKNSALWCLINLCHFAEDQYEVIRKLVDQDIFQTLKVLLKDKKNNMLFENIIWLALNISMEDVEYRCKLLEEGFLFFIGNYIQFISDMLNNKQPQEAEINGNQLKVMLNLCTVMLSVHERIEDQQFRIITSIMKLCLQMNKADYFKLITNGITSLFVEDSPLSESKFNILYEARFFSQYFLQCMQNEEDMILVSNLYKYLSLQDAKYIMDNLISIKITFILLINQLLTKQDLILPIYILMSHPLSNVRENILFSLSNFFMNGVKFIEIASQYMLDAKIIASFEEESTEVQKEAVWALANLLEYQNNTQKEEFLSNRDIIQKLCQYLNKNFDQIPDQILSKLLDCLIYILDFGEYMASKDEYESNPFWIALERYQSANVIDKIAVEGSSENQKRAQKILDEYTWFKQL